MEGAAGSVHSVLLHSRSERPAKTQVQLRRARLGRYRSVLVPVSRRAEKAGVPMRSVNHLRHTNRTAEPEMSVGELAILARLRDEVETVEKYERLLKGAKSRRNLLIMKLAYSGASHRFIAPYARLSTVAVDNVVKAFNSLKSNQGEPE